MAKAYAAFFRNTNLGRPGSPTRTQLESAFLAAGASAVANVRSNGTIAFDAPDAVGPHRVLDDAAAELRFVCGLAEPASVRSLVDLRALPWETVFAGIAPEGVHEFTVSFACGAAPTRLELPLSSPRGDAVVLWCQGGVALSVTRKVMSGPGSPNVLLERVTKMPFTSRTLGTIQHILAKHG